MICKITKDPYWYNRKIEIKWNDGYSSGRSDKIRELLPLDSESIIGYRIQINNPILNLDDNLCYRYGYLSKKRWQIGDKFEGRYTIGNK